MNPKNGEVLAMASWPTFDPATFNENYNALASDPNNPIWNRAIGGTYEPGSTFKMLTSIAALESGVITPQTVIVDEGVYRYYDDYQPRCWIYHSSGRTHGAQTVTDAVKNSCNYFYYEVGRLMGIETLNEYAKKFGLGERAGFELASEESKGRLAGQRAGRLMAESRGARAIRCRRRLGSRITSLHRFSLRTISLR